MQRFSPRLFVPALIWAALIGGLCLALTPAPLAAASQPPPLPADFARARPLNVAAPDVDPVVQVTDSHSDYNPALVQAANGKLWAFFNSYRTGGYDYLWYETSTDGGATWSAASEFTHLGDDDYTPAAASGLHGELWVVWHRTESGHNIWYRSSSDNGETWSTAARLTDDPGVDLAPDIARDDDGTLWVVWYSSRSGNNDIWYKTSSDGGVTWSADAQLTSSPLDDTEPTVAQARDGKIWVVWARSGQSLYYRTLAPLETEWSDEAAIAMDLRYEPNLVRASNGDLWLAAGRDADIWYQTSANDGEDWSAPAKLTRYVGSDGDADLVSLAGGGVGIAWHSDRGQQWWSDVWFGEFGVREDTKPPPSSGYIGIAPGAPDSTQEVVVHISAADESPGLAVSLVWSLDGVAQGDLTMYDDGTHGDPTAGDSQYHVTIGPFPAGTLVNFQARATDSDGNSILHPTAPGWFRVQTPFVKTADLLLVVDDGGSSTDSFRGFYTAALDSLGYSYDVWDTGVRKFLPASVLAQYAGGVTIWAAPWEGYVGSNFEEQEALHYYLDVGGRLFISGQNIARNLYNRGARTLLNDYLHANYVQDDAGLYQVTGVAADPIGDSLSLNLSGGDGANNQYSKDEIGPIGPAEAVFTYQSGAALAPHQSAPTSAGGGLDEDVAFPAPVPAATPLPGEPFVHPTPQAIPASVARAASEQKQSSSAGPTTALVPAASAAPKDIIGSGTAGLRVETETYKLVYLAFGFEGINSAAQRAVVMERVLAWLNGVPARPGLLTPADGAAVPAGDVAFSWTTVPGAAEYEIQIDTSPAFDSAGLIDDTVGDTSYTHSFSTIGTRYWRVRAVGGAWTNAWRFAVVDDVVQVTTDPSDDYSPAIVQAGEDKLWAVWYSSRSGNDDLWYKTSDDDGATWSADQRLTTDPSSDYFPAIAEMNDGKLWVVWTSYRSGNADLWYKIWDDDSATWSAEQQLTTDPNGDYDPVIVSTPGGALWVVWYSLRSGNADIWVTTSSDEGENWSPAAQLTTSTDGDYGPAAAVASDGRIVVVWYRNGELWQRSSTADLASWAPEVQVAGCCRYNPSLASAGAELWLAFDQNGDIWRRTSSDNGDTWSAEARFTRFVGGDYAPGVAALAGGRAGIAWYSNRSGNWDIWFGIPGEREDLDPGPYVSNIEHQPASNPASDVTITFRAWARDETGVASVALVWNLDGAAQGELPMFDDGAHGDDAAGDGVWAVQLAPLPAGSQVTYRARATETGGKTYLYPGQSSFIVVTPFVKTADLLFVPDYGGNDTAWFQPYYTNALDTFGYTYDTWDTRSRGVVPGAVLSQYTSGAVIWAIPFWGYLTNWDSQQRATVQSYLDGGGRLFITGQDVGYNLYYNDPAFLAGYLHATYVQGDTGLYALAGAAGDPIGDGLALNLSGGDGANNQYSKDEIDPVSPAVPIFTYQAGASAMLAEPVRPETAIPPDPREAGPQDAARPQPPGDHARKAEVAPAPEDIIGSGTAGLRVETEKYKLVYLAFGFEGINSAAQRAVVMERVLAWLNGVPARPGLLTPADGQAVPTGDLAFSWTTVPGAAEYEIQIDVEPSFDPSDLIAATVSNPGYTGAFTTLGTRYWRVRALPGGAWTNTWRFAVMDDVVQVTADPLEDSTPALVQIAPDKLLTVFVRDGGLWSRVSSDGGATWGSEMQIDGCCRYNPSLAVDPDGLVWLAYYRDGDIWYRTSDNEGDTWSAEQQLTADPSDDWDPVIVSTPGRALWVAWTSTRSGNADIWVTTSSDGGVNWTAAAQLTTSTDYDYGAAAAVAPDGRLVVAWYRNGELWQRTNTSDAWTPEVQVAGCCRYGPSLAAAGGELWLAYEQSNDIWYRRSTDNGFAWSAETRFTRFIGWEYGAALAALPSGRVGLAWSAYRGGNYDIWFGIPGEREDLNPGPFVNYIEHQPGPNPTSTDTVTVLVDAADETGVAAVELVWTLDGISQSNMAMVNAAPWAVQLAPLPAGSQVTYRARATDTGGKTYLSYERSFQVLAPFVKTADLLFVPDFNGNDTTWFQPYYANALDALGYTYDTWDTRSRGVVPGAVLSQYTSGAVIWAIPEWGYLTNWDSSQRAAVQSYLDDGGKLFVTGQNIAEYLNSSDAAFLTNYLHATYVQYDTGLYALAGAAGDPIGDGLALNLSGGDGANNQYSKDEIDPVSPAVAIFAYQAGASAMLAEPVRPETATPPDPGEAGPQDAARARAPDDHARKAEAAPAPENNIGSGTAGLRVDTGTYKLVYLAFGFEGINSAADRTEVMRRVLAWLGVCSAPDTPGSLSIGWSAAGAVLDWGDVDAGAYEVWHVADSPYFDPGDTCTAPDCETTADITLTHEEAFADPPHNYFYAVRAVAQCGARSAATKRVGAFTFSLVPGSANPAGR